MDEGAVNTRAHDAATVRAPGAVDTGSRRGAQRAPRRSSLSRDLTILAIVGVLLISALGAGWAVLLASAFAYADERMTRLRAQHQQRAEAPPAG